MAAKSAPAGSGEQSEGWFLYGIVPGDVEATKDARGLGDPPGRVIALAHDEVGALVSEIGLDRPLGEPEDLVIYQRLLDGTATVAPVIPVRFGTVLTNREAVVELLVGQHDEFLAALDELEGRVEFIVRGRYAEGPLLREILAENPEATELRDQIRGKPEESTVNLRIRLGEIINLAVESKRAADTQRLIDALAPVSVAALARQPTHEEDAAQAAFLVEKARQTEFDDALDALVDEWGERVNVRLQGPLAAYDFIPAIQLRS